MVGVILLLAGCARGSEQASSGPARGPGQAPSEHSASPEPTLPPSPAVALAPLPRNGLQRCRALELVAEACPRRVPRTRSPYLLSQLGGPGEPAEILELAASAHNERRPRLNRPPRFAHVVIQAGGVRAELGTSEGEGLKRASLRDDLLGERAGYFSLGSFTWGGKSGELILAPPYPHGGMHGDHLIFMWDGERALSLHAWLPLAEATATLQAMVESISN